MKRIVFLMVSFILMTPYINAQEKKKFAVRTVAFYNVENLFDTINDPHKFDDDRTPEGADRWTSKVYNDHVHKIAKVISEIGSDVTKLLHFHTLYTSPKMTGSLFTLATNC